MGIDQIGTARAPLLLIHVELQTYIYTYMLTQCSMSWYPRIHRKSQIVESECFHGLAECVLRTPYKNTDFNIGILDIKWCSLLSIMQKCSVGGLVCSNRSRSKEVFDRGL